MTVTFNLEGCTVLPGSQQLEVQDPDWRSLPLIKNRGVGVPLNQRANLRGLPIAPWKKKKEEEQKWVEKEQKRMEEEKEAGKMME